MKFDPMKEKNIRSKEGILMAGNYIEIPAEKGRKPEKKEEIEK